MITTAIVRQDNFVAVFSGFNLRILSNFIEHDNTGKTNGGGEGSRALQFFFVNNASQIFKNLYFFPGDVHPSGEKFGLLIDLFSFSYSIPIDGTSSVNSPSGSFL